MLKTKQAKNLVNVQYCKLDICGHELTMEWGAYKAMVKATWEGLPTYIKCLRDADYLVDQIIHDCWIKWALLNEGEQTNQKPDQKLYCFLLQP